MIAICEARVHAALTRAELGAAIGRSADWLASAETEAITLDAETERKILTAISRLARFAETVRTAKEKLTLDLRLPPLPLQHTRSHPIPGGGGPRRRASAQDS